LDEVPSVRDLPNAIHFKEPVREVVYDKISFKYQTGGEIFSDFSLSVKAGEVLAIVGQSGSGKSTLVNLLPRFYDPSTGAVRVNGTDLKNMTLKSLRDMIAIVTQDTILFNGTVRENIAYANPQASMVEVETAAQAAQAHTFISAMPQGYDTNIGDRGMNLSGGQRQRLSIARALLKNPPILILDEATSNLDTQSESEVQIALENLMKGRTVFVIAHRLSTVKKANRIIVMRHGKVIEEGTHEVLLAKNGIYKDLYDLQFSAKLKPLKMFSCFVADFSSLCGVGFTTPPRALICASHLKHFERVLF
jgi:subfamily B ATP-binding cassette protein MsbA